MLIDVSLEPLGLSVFQVVTKWSLNAACAFNEINVNSNNSEFF